MTTHHRAAGRKGGRRMTPAKRKALAKLHASRRGVSLHPMDEDTRRLLSSVAAITRQASRGGSNGPDPRSVRSLALHLGVSDRTVRRWIRGEDAPDPRHLQGVEVWAKGHR